MKLRYYLRGLGIGILMTVVILTIAGVGKETMTDEEIKARAKELGMVESTVLSGMNTPASSEEPEETATPEPSKEPEDTASPENVAVPENIETPETSEESDETTTLESSVESEDSTDPKPSADQEDTVTPSPSEEPEATATPKPSEEPEATVTPAPSTGTENVEEQTVTIVISAGDSSVSVSKDLEAAGLVESASAYDKYLCDNGYDRKIRTGTFEIPVNADEEEIAWIITHKQ